MSKENPAKLAGNVNNNKQKRATSGEQASKLHLSGVAISGSTQQDHDLTPSPSKTSTSATNGGGQAAAAAAAAASAGVSADSSPMSSPSKSCSSSPSKSSPSKSKNRNKRKNEAKRRSAELKRQQQAATTESAPAKMHQSADKQAPSAPASSEAQEELKQEMKPSDTQPEPQVQDVKQSDEQMDRSSSPRLAVADDARGEDPTLVTSQPLEDNQPPISGPTEGEHNTNTDTNGNSHTLATDQKGVNSNGHQQHHQKASVETNSLHRKQKENRELREQLKAREVQFRELAERFKQQMSRTREVETSLVSTTKTCAQFEKLLQQELASRTRLEGENETLNSALTRLRNQVGVLEKEKTANNELIRVLNATLMERETEVSILKLKMTRIQTNSTSTTHVANMSQFNPPSSSSLVKNRDPQKAFTMGGRSNSEFSRNTRARSTMMAEAINTRSSTSQLQHYNERDASIWAAVPEELTPSKRPLLLERNLPNHIYNSSGIYNNDSPSPIGGQQSSTPILRDRRYRTLPRSMKNPLQSSQKQDDEQYPKLVASSKQQVPLPQTPAKCIVTNLDEGNTSKSSGEATNTSSTAEPKPSTTSGGIGAGDLSGLPVMAAPSTTNTTTTQAKDSFSSGPSDPLPLHDKAEQLPLPITLEKTKPPPHLPAPKSPSTPVKRGLKKILSKFKRSDSSTAPGESQSQSKSDLKSNTSIVTAPTQPSTSAFHRGATRSTLVGPPTNLRAQISPKRAIDFQTDKPFAEWDTDMLVDWLTMIGLSMYASQCRRWVKCGAHIMNATPAEVDKGLGITNHLHRKKLRLAISELNGDCDKITKAAAKLDYLWVARWLDDIGLPQHKEAFINARVDGRVLNYLTVEDLVSLGVKSLLHHSSIRCGIRVLRSINFDLQLLKRRATAEEIEQMNTMRQSIDERSNSSLANKQAPAATGTASNNAQEQQQQQQVRACDETDVPLWTCHRVMEWLRMIDFAEFAPNLRGSGVHGGLIMYEDAFNVDTMSTLLSIPTSRTLLRRHLSTFFENLVGDELAQRKKQHKQLSSTQQLNPASEIKTHKKSPLWFGKLKSSKVGQDGAMDEYLCPMYPVEPQIVKNSSSSSSARNSSVESHMNPHREPSNLPIIPESINV